MSDYIFQTVRHMPQHERELFMEGYRVGESERLSLAKANSQLRSIILELRNKIDEYERTS